ncbi:hypothetical protein RHMOL_Rhmol10G0242500 [Rhododendron molle]|uniref:Uncharacterized protein n=1 Tax=Rhododendron molle TaxID=49168 RepID=A0ACC0M6R7_RHOML|nr:hypothetical protein RHMOL_Rhmol10G0242500 [Rhododendron molle]
MCNKGSRVLIMLDTMGLVPKPPHRCLIPVADDLDKIVIPKRRTPSEVVEQLTYHGGCGRK